MLRLKDIKIVCSKEELAAIPDGKVLINTINAHSYNTAQKDELFAEALKNGDALIPDGASVVKACRWLKAKYQPKERIAGWDLFEYEMGKQEERGKRKEEGEHQTPKSQKSKDILTEDGRNSAAPIRLRLGIVSTSRTLHSTCTNLHGNPFTNQRLCSWVLRRRCWA